MILGNGQSVRFKNPKGSLTLRIDQGSPTFAIEIGDRNLLAFGEAVMGGRENNEWIVVYVLRDEFL